MILSFRLLCDSLAFSDISIDLNQVNLITFFFLVVNNCLNIFEVTFITHFVASIVQPYFVFSPIIKHNYQFHIVCKFKSPSFYSPLTFISHRQSFIQFLLVPLTFSIIDPIIIFFYLEVIY